MCPGKKMHHDECMSEYQEAMDLHREALERVQSSATVEELTSRCGSREVAVAFSAIYPCWEGLRNALENATSALAQSESNFSVARQSHQFAMQLVEDRTANLAMLRRRAQSLAEELQELKTRVQHANESAATAEMRLSFTRDPAAAARQKTDDVKRNLRIARHAVDAAAAALADAQLMERDLAERFEQQNSSLALSSIAESSALSSLGNAKTELRRITEQCDERREDLAAVVVTVEIEDKNATRLRREHILGNKTFWENATRLERDELRSILDEELSRQSEVDMRLDAANITDRKVFAKQQVSTAEDAFNSSLVALDTKYLERQTTNQKLETCYESLGTLWNAYETAKGDLEVEQEYMRDNNIESRSFNLVLGDDKWHQEQEQKQQGG
mmetsp:Transcript_35737/g.80288  ORF Transcript_35737/g.80288 Transcript_35737/m.80288 type:complete len:388 (+) Transcript_35737:2345-3508(+)